MAPDALFEVALHRYERSRLWWAALTASPVLAIPLASFAVGHRLVSTALLAVALVAVAVGALFSGRHFKQGLTAGLIGGLVPLVLAHAANLYGHLCTPTGCSTLCVPACSIGGIAAGLVVVLAARRAKTSHAAWLTLASGGLTACLVGAFGCSCVGWSGLLSMIAAATVTMGAGMVKRT